ncbi:Protein CBR-YOP-1 [Caenorhabditis briggsae]|uniref:Receptor expression-enhancing protein n=3 Tax=Caenorhabditis TaxID=6237 RepID=A0AAE9DT65_CAEBR|nr:Protein CBR-YOP-1 [Caenorhabditis briggsae]PIC55874.1 hypothetical protein B9Z55_000972 [Caenorhabditis nigoni]ULU10185.1 hypothetical protein L3Y34_014478 [Caenorhabditis briggsae]UMM11117.1 hypothetical protein L5515_000559 [Caenorhabditis briggsae]CAP24897.1 Protein CBR-YOP-1 [Caenorhabditis briggsae]
MPVPPQAQKVLDDIDKQLHEPSTVTNVLATVEAKTGLKRLHIVLGVVGLQAIYLIFGHSAQLVCNVMGFVYPAYMSIKAIESSNKEDDTQWLTYWVVFAILSVVEFFSVQIVAVFPVYWLFKSLFLLYLYLPTFLGATKLYHRFVKPVVARHNHGSIDAKIGNFADRVNSAAGKLASDVRDHLE